MMITIDIIVALAGGLLAGGAAGASAAHAVLVHQAYAVWNRRSRPIPRPSSASERPRHLVVPRPAMSRHVSRPDASARVLTEADRPAIDGVTPFLDWMGELSLAAWLAVGRAVTDNQAERTARITASMILDATIADRDLELAAWYVRDALETIAFLASRRMPRLSRADRRLFAAAYDAAEQAALGMLAHDHLAPLDFGTLTAPFQGHARFS